MSTVVIYDSSFGNTEKVARAISESLGASLLHVKDADMDVIEQADQLIVGSPTQGGRPTVPIQQFIRSLPENALVTVNVGAFDTRFDEAEQKLPVRLLMKTIGYAAPKISKMLAEKGGNVRWEDAGFIVRENEGPLRDGELDRAAEWAMKPQLKLRMI